MALVKLQLRKATQWAHEFVFSDRAGPESTAKSFAYLYDVARRTVQRKRVELLRDPMADAPRAVPIKDKGKMAMQGTRKRCLRHSCFRFLMLRGT